MCRDSSANLEGLLSRRARVVAEVLVVLDKREGTIKLHNERRFGSFAKSFLESACYRDTEGAATNKGFAVVDRYVLHRLFITNQKGASR